MTSTLPYGSWPSPISASDVAAGSHPIDGARYVADDVYWLERMPAEGSRSAVRRHDDDGRPVTVLEAPWNVGSRVHEYGGRAWDAAADGTIVFAEKSDQRLWLKAPAASPAPLTPADAGMRFADLALAELPGVGRAVLAVRETHLPDRPAPVRDIVAVPLDGSAADDAAGMHALVTGADFFAYPRLSPGGDRLAWVSWNHPEMPWTSTSLHVGELAAGGHVEHVVSPSGPGRQSAIQPEWLVRPSSPGADPHSDELLFSTDASGRWNLRRLAVGGISSDEEIAPADADTGGALWSLGARWYAPLPDERILAVRVDGADELVVIGPDGTLTPLDTPLRSRIQVQDVRGSRVLLTGAGPTTFGGLWEIDLDDDDPQPRLLRGIVDEPLDPAWLPPARAITVDGPHGPVHAFAYPPTNPDVVAPDDALPPYLVLVHGGPTGHSGPEASPTTAYFTSRGIGVLDVNYGGSTGYGRAYRERLDGAWGVVDRDDVVAAARGLAAAGLADADRLAIRGGSAGGWTVLCALTATDAFAAGISRYGVADLRALAADTHDFEARYLDGLVGPLPEAEDVYLDRSPLSHLDRFTTPMLIEQGLDDPVVPPSQSEAVRDALAARGVPHAYLPFEGESHGFRKAETIRRSLEAELGFLGAVLGFTPADAPVLRLEAR